MADQPDALTRSPGNNGRNFDPDRRDSQKDTRIVASAMRLAGTFIATAGRVLKARLPTRLCHAGNKAGGGHLTESDTGQPETAKKGPTPTRYLTAVDHTGRAGITRQHTETDIVLLRLQFMTEILELLYRPLLAVISLDPALLCHGRASVTWNHVRFKGFLTKRQVFLLKLGT